MTIQRALESAPAVEEQRDGVADLGGQSAQVHRWHADEPIPARVSLTDLQRGLGLSRATFYRLKAKGRFAFLELQPTLDPHHPIYSGFLLARWLRGGLAQQGPVPRAFFHVGQSARGRRRRATQEERET